jgi:hypothetical protein
MNVQYVYCIVEPYRLLYVNLKLSSGKLSYSSDIWQAFGAIMYLLEPKSVGLFY